MIKLDREAMKSRYEQNAMSCGAKKSLDIKNAVNQVTVQNGHADVKLVGAIDDLWGIDVSQTINQLNRDDLKSIHVVIDSPGGLFWDGLSLYHDLRAKARAGVAVSTEGRGLVASAAVLPFLAATDRSLVEGTTMLIHEPYIFAIIGGTSEDVATESAKIVNFLESANKSLTNLIRSNIGAAYRGKVAGWLKAEKIFDAKEAEEIGMIEKVIDEEQDEKIENKTPLDNPKEIVDTNTDDPYEHGLEGLNFDNPAIYGG